MKITRKQLRRLINEAVNSIESEAAPIPEDLVIKVKTLISTGEQENNNMAGFLIESFYTDLYQIEISEGDFISVAVKAPVDSVMENKDLSDFMMRFNLNLDSELPFTTKAQEPPMKPEFTLEDDLHTRVYFELPEEDLEVDFDYDEESSEEYYDEEPSGFENSRFIQDPRHPDRGDYY